MSKKLKLKGKLKAYLQIPLLLGMILMLVDAWIYLISVQAGIVLSIFLLIYLVTLIVLSSLSKQTIMNELVSFATEYGQIQKELLKELELPHALLDESGKLIWLNNAFGRIVDKDSIYLRSITTVFPEINRDKLPNSENNVQYSIAYNDRDYLLRMKRVGLRDMALIAGTADENEEYDGYLIAVYLFDETALKLALKEIDDQSLAVGLIYIDNYEEAVESVDDVGRSLLGAFIDRQINQYAASFDGIVRKTEKDKYLLILRKSALNTIKQTRFMLLEDVKGISMGNDTAVTLSIGIGVDGLTYAQNSEFARNAIDLALGRGGDQAVVKSPETVSYYGGKSQQKETNTRVKARIKAQALQEIIASKERVLVMGHRDGDVDSFGASVGIKCVCQNMDKECHIVLDTVSASLRPLVELYKSHSDYQDDWILGSQNALDIADNETVLVVVDVNKPAITECPELIKRCKTIVVLDHHRQSQEVVENATLNYIEPNSSSASEMVAEILQYVNNGAKLKSIVADCLYSGIVIDTHNFEAKTGVRTFEAAAYLRRNGADVTRVRKLFRDEAVNYQAKADAVRRAEIHNGSFAISYSVSDGIESPTVVAAQAANELLNIVGIKASFVLTDYNGKIYISARSIDEVNVQLVMEKMGGGGHMTIAGAQIENSTIEDVITTIKNTLDDMLEKEEI